MSNLIFHVPKGFDMEYNGAVYTLHEIMDALHIRGLDMEGLIDVLVNVDVTNSHGVPTSELFKSDLFFTRAIEVGSKLECNDVLWYESGLEYIKARVYEFLNIDKL